MNNQKKVERRQLSWVDSEKKQRDIEKSKRWIRRVKFRVSLFAEKFTGDETPEVEDLDFQMF